MKNFLLLALITVFSFACGSDSHDHDHSSHEGHNHSDHEGHNHSDHSADGKSDEEMFKDKDYSTEKKTDKGGFTVSYVAVTADSKIPLNEIFDLKVTVTPLAADKKIAIDAAMPQHKHGMNVKPELKTETKTDSLEATATGMKFHMPGYWEIYVIIGEGDEMEKATFSVMVKQANDEASK